MSKPEPPSFHTRLPQDLKDQLDAARGGRSLNREIVDRLQKSFDTDPVFRFAELLRPYLESLEADEQAELFHLAERAIAIIGKAKKQARR